MSRPWVRRLLLAVVVYAVLMVVTSWLGWGPDAVRIALAVGLLTAAVALGSAALVRADGTWDVAPVSWVQQPGRDRRLALFTRVLDGHRTARTPDVALRDQLGQLADRELVRVHGLHRGDPRAEALLGPELFAVLSEPPRRLPPAELERHLTRIEQL